MRVRALLPIPLVLCSLGVMGSLSRGADGDSGAGKDVFARRCSGCHSLDSDKEGPRLRGVVNRKVGTVQNFVYSNALRTSNIYWDEKRLNEWLANPDAVVKETDMEFRVSSAEERAAIIAYLKSGK